MRRRYLYTAGLMIAAGASFAFASPAAAAGSTPQPSWNPFTSSAPSQSLGQTSWSQQTVLNNVGNPQIGFRNSNSGGSATANNWTNQGAVQGFGGARRPSGNLLQNSVNTQIVLNNVGNPQIGFGNSNGGGSATANNFTNQGAAQTFGGFRF